MAKKKKLKTNMPALSAIALKPAYIIVNDECVSAYAVLADGGDEYATLKSAERALTDAVTEDMNFLPSGTVAGAAIIKVSYELVGQPVYYTNEEIS